MANPFKTGRSGTVVISGTMTGDFFSHKHPGIPPVGSSSGADSNGEFSPQWGVLPTNAPTISWGLAPQSPTPQDGWFLSATDGYGASQTSLDVTPPLPAPSDWSETPTGTWSFSVDVDEYEIVYAPTAVTTIDGTDFPNYGGAAQGDSLPATGCQRYLVAAIGGNQVVAATLGSAAVSITTPTTSEFPVSLFCTRNIETIVDSTGITATANASCTAQVAFGGATVSLDLIAQTWNGGASAPLFGGFGTVTFSAGGQISVTATSNVAGGASASGSGSSQPKTEFSLGAKLRCFGSPYPSSQGLFIQQGSGLSTVLTLSPANSTTWSQEFYDIAASVATNAPSNQNFGPIAKNTTGPVAAWLNSPAPDDTRDWRCQIQGFQWPVLSVKRSGPVVADDCTATANWTAGAHTAISIVSGTLEAEVSGGVGSLSLAVPTAKRVWEAFRFLQVSGFYSAPAYDNSTAYTGGERVSSGGSTYQCISATTGNAPPDATYWNVYTGKLNVTVALAGQTWNFSLTDTPSSPQLDLCCSDTETETVEPKDSRFPIKTPGGGPPNTDPTDQYKLGWGVDWCDSLTIGGIPDGYSLTLSGISLVLSTGTDKQAAITFLEPFLNFLAGWNDPTDNTAIQQFAYVETDHRKSDIGIALAHVAPTNGSPPSYTYLTIAELVSYLQYLPGLAVTQLADASDTYHVSSLPALMVGGTGETYDYSAGTWKSWIDVDISGGTAINVPAIDLFDEVQVYPLCGDLWVNGAFGATTPLQISKALRGAAEGLVFKSTDVPYPAADVNAFETANPAMVVGAAITDDDGSYLTGTPWGRGNVAITTELHQGETPYLHQSDAWANRWRDRTSFRKDTDVAKPIGYDVSRSFRHVRTYTRISTGTFFLGCASNQLPNTWNDIDSGLTAIWARCRFQKLGPEAPIGVFYGDGTTCTWARTYNEGQTYEDSIDMADGVLGDYTDDPSGRKWFFKVLSSDGGTTFDVWGKLLDNNLNVVRDWTITNLTGVDDQSLACGSSTASDGSWRVILFYSVGGSDIVKQSPEGLTFS